MQTVDLMDYLNEKVVAGGIVNLERARRAPTRMGKLPVEEAVRQARQEVGEQKMEVSSQTLESGYKGEVLPLAGLW